MATLERAGFEILVIPVRAAEGPDAVGSGLGSESRTGLRGRCLPRAAPRHGYSSRLDSFGPGDGRLPSRRTSTTGHGPPISVKATIREQPPAGAVHRRHRTRFPIGRSWKRDFQHPGLGHRVRPEYRAIRDRGIRLTLDTFGRRRGGAR
jgi:hypothetical protein